MVRIDIVSPLGTGKTTFANMLLRHYLNSGLRPVYIVNEFGQTGLDAEIISAEGFEAVEIQGGCVCCTLRQDVATAITRVIDAFSPTHIVFEPSGIFTFDGFLELLKQPEISQKCELANVFTVVDGVHFSFSKAVYGSFLYHQIKNAGVILISKLEKTKQNVEELICDIQNINPSAFLMSKIWNQWDVADFEFLLSQPKSTASSHHAHHHSRLRSLTVRPGKPLTQDELNRFLACCASGVFGNLCRVKGIVMTEEYPVLLHIAMGDVTLTRWGGASEPTLTFIGQTVRQREILQFLKA